MRLGAGEQGARAVRRRALTVGRRVLPGTTIENNVFVTNLLIYKGKSKYQYQQCIFRSKILSIATVITLLYRTSMNHWSSEMHSPHWTSVILQIAPKRWCTV